MRFAYADPPYPGQASRYKDGVEVNHELLVAHLREFDGWALSTSAAALRDVWNMAPEARCAAWVKTWASNGWSRVRWSWEPVLFVTPTKGIAPGDTSRVWDSLVAAPRTGQGAWQEIPGKGGGSKPSTFVEWLLELVGFENGDEFVDIFPGSGGVAAYVDARPIEMAL